VRTFWMLGALAISAGAALGHTSYALPSDRSLVFADLDGDKRADTVDVRLQSSGPAGLTYALNFTVSGSSAGTSKLIVVKRWGIDVIPRDVDGDHDLDLVIESLATHEAVAVLVNDGNGGFAAAEASLFPSALWHERESVDSDEPRTENLGIDENGGRDDLAILGSPRSTHPEINGPFSSRLSPSAVTRPAIHGRSRAPPLS